MILNYKGKGQTVVSQKASRCQPLYMSALFLFSMAHIQREIFGIRLSYIFKAATAPNVRHLISQWVCVRRNRTNNISGSAHSTLFDARKAVCGRSNRLGTFSFSGIYQANRCIASKLWHSTKSFWQCYPNSVHSHLFTRLHQTQITIIMTMMAFRVSGPIFEA